MNDWQSWDDHEIAEEVCTQLQIDVLRIWVRGYGRKRGPRMLGITEAAWRFRLGQARDRIQAAKQAKAA